MHGFYNNGNTCYFNSALQCVLRIHDLSSHILRNNYEKECTFTKLYKELVGIYFNKENFLKINIEPLLHTFQEKFPRF
jgi:ubiquitin C-terminal hydrolase